MDLSLKELSRKKFVIFLIVITLFLAVVLFFPTKTQEKKIEQINKVISLDELSIVDYGEDQKVAIAYLNVQPIPQKKQKAIFILYENFPITKIIYVDGKWAGATKNQEFKKQLKLGAQKYGFEFKEIEINELNKNEEGIVFIPSGVWPVSLSKDLGKKVNQKNILIYMGTDQNISIDEEGKIIKGGLNNLVLNATKPLGIIPQAYKNDQEIQLIFIKQTIDEIRDLKSFTDNFYQMLLIQQIDKVKMNEKEFSGNYFDYIIASEKDRYAAILYFEDNKIEQVWIRQIDTYLGRAIALKKSDSGMTPLQVILKTPENQKLNFYARVLDKNFEEKDIKKIGSFEGSGSFWVGSLPYLKLPNSRNIIIEIMDQYKRVYAKAMIEGAEYKISLQNARGSTREYCISKNNKEYDKKTILIRKSKDEKWTAVGVVNSCFAVSSKWGEKNVLYFKIDELEFLDEWELEKNRWRIFIELGLPAALVFLIWFIFFKKEKNVYILQVPEYASLEQIEVEINKKDVLDFVSEVKKFEDIRKYIFEKIKAEKGVAITTESIENVLIELANKGLLKKYLDYYAPITIPQEEFEDKIVKTTIMEFLKKHGVILNKQMVDSRGRKWASLKDLESLKEIPDYIVFVNEERKKEYLEKLKLLQKENEIKFLIAIYIKRIKIKTVEELLKEEEYY